jgi:hypothetical protein
MARWWPLRGRMGKTRSSATTRQPSAHSFGVIRLARPPQGEIRLDQRTPASRRHAGCACGDSSTGAENRPETSPVVIARVTADAMHEPFCLEPEYQLTAVRCMLAQVVPKEQSDWAAGHVRVPTRAEPRTLARRCPSDRQRRRRNCESRPTTTCIGSTPVSSAGDVPFGLLALYVLVRGWSWDSFIGRTVCGSGLWIAQWR